MLCRMFIRCTFKTFARLFKRHDTYTRSLLPFWIRKKTNGVSSRETRVDSNRIGFIDRMYHVYIGVFAAEFVYAYKQRASCGCRLV